MAETAELSGGGGDALSSQPSGLFVVPSDIARQNICVVVSVEECSNSKCSMRRHNNALSEL